MVLSWYEQKACVILLTLLSLGIKDILRVQRAERRLFEVVDRGVFEYIAVEIAADDAD